VVEFLTDAWVAELDAAARAVRLPADLSIVVQQVVLADRGDVSEYTVRVADGRASVTRGRADDAHVVFTQDRATAAAIAKGELSAQAAFLAGRLRVGGDVRQVIDRARDLQVLDDVFGPTRAVTTW
jgi:putative sterol carrier protein